MENKKREEEDEGKKPEVKENLRGKLSGLFSFSDDKKRKEDKSPNKLLKIINKLGI
jgi:hypothetical protein